MDPGYPPKEPVNFLKIVENLECNSLCPNCETIYTPELRHCYICNRCIDRFDHHCNWINNCVGKRNHCVFYLYIITLLTYFLIIDATFLYNVHTSVTEDDLRNGGSHNLLG